MGDLDLRFETMELPADPGLALLLYTAEPGSETEQALTFLASWAAGNVPDRADPGHQPALLNSAPSPEDSLDQAVPVEMVDAQVLVRGRHTMTAPSAPPPSAPDGGGVDVDP